MTDILVNGEPTQIPDAVTLQAWLDQQLAAGRLREPFAIALNGEFLARARYGEVSFHSGDTLDIVAPVGGG